MYYVLGSPQIRSYLAAMLVVLANCLSVLLVCASAQEAVPLNLTDPLYLAIACRCCLHTPLLVHKLLGQP